MSRLEVRAPFHLEATVRVLQRRPSNLVDVWEGGRYRRLLMARGASVLAEVRNLGTIDAPDVCFTVLSNGTASRDACDVEATLRRMLGLDLDPEALPAAALARHESLRSTVRALRGMRPPRFAGLFEAFLSVVPFQQVSIDAGSAVLGRLVERFGLGLEHGNRRFYAVPRACIIARAKVEDLRECGLSARKAQTLIAVGRAIDCAELSADRIAQMTTAEAVERLCSVPGIGPWSAALVLLRGCGRLDVFPPGDVGAIRELSAQLHLESESELARLIESCGDARGRLYFFGIAGNLLQRGLIHAAPKLD